MACSYVGANLSKEWIDIYNPRGETHRRIDNTAISIRKLFRSLCDDEILIFEATSGCDDILLAQIRSEGARFVRVNPAHAWHFSRACNLPKTDKVEAQMLSAFGAARTMQPQRTNTQERDHLRALVKRRRQYKDMQTQEKNRLKRVADRNLARDIESLLNILERRVIKLEKQIRELLENSDELSRITSLLASAPGIGPVAASVLVADMPELGTADRRQIVSLAGLAPRAYESGKYKGKRRLADGRRHVRKVLYMAVLSVIAQGRFFQPFIQRMKREGKANKAIIVAVARKLLTILNTLVSQQKPFDSNKLEKISIPQ